jgi:hypothetical protein
VAPARQLAWQVAPIPLTLNDPVGWKASIFKNTGAPIAALMERDFQMGVETWIGFSNLILPRALPKQQ